MDAGADFHIPKPYEGDYLLGKISTILASGRISKREVNELCRRAGETVRYPSQEAGSTDAETVVRKS